MSSDPPRVLLSVDDLTDGDVRDVLARSSAYARVRPAPPLRDGPIVGLLFLTPSLRTRVGFAVAAARLGGRAVDVAEFRWQTGMTVGESLPDTIRTVAGMVDAVVARVPDVLDHDWVDPLATSPLISGGDGREHPTQALIDLAAMEAETDRPLEDLTVALCGDLGSRTATSVLRLLARRPPERLVLMAPPGRAGTTDSLPAHLEAITERRPHLDPAGIDVLSMVGLPEGSGAHRLDGAAREPFTLTAAAMTALPARAVVLSPMPVVDEIGTDARRDPRCRFHAQSDRAVAVRAAVLDLVLSHPPTNGDPQ